MDTIVFADVPIRLTDTLRQVFQLIKSGKESGAINEALLRNALGERVNYFVSDPQQIRELAERWRKDKSTSLRWEFGSWVDALTSCALIFHSLRLTDEGSGELQFERLAWPSGGLEATEEIIKIFDGKVLANSAI